MPAAVPVVVVLLWVLWCAGVYWLPRCSYTLVGGTLRIHWRAFKVIPFSRLAIRFSDIAEVRRFDLRRDWWLPVFVIGRFLRARAILIVLRRRRLVVIKRICISPPDPDRLMEEIKRRLPSSE